MKLSVVSNSPFLWFLFLSFNIDCPMNWWCIYLNRIHEFINCRKKVILTKGILIYNTKINLWCMLSFEPMAWLNAVAFHWFCVGCSFVFCVMCCRVWTLNHNNRLSFIVCHLSFVNCVWTSIKYPTFGVHLAIVFMSNVVVFLLRVDSFDCSIFFLDWDKRFWYYSFCFVSFYARNFLQILDV